MLRNSKEEKGRQKKFSSIVILIILSAKLFFSFALVNLGCQAVKALIVLTTDPCLRI